MRQLKSIAAVGGAVALIGIWPLAVGQIGQTVLTDAIQNVNNTDFNVELVEYDRGYLGSTATTRITVVDPQAKAQLDAYGLPDSFELKHQISHGMFSLGGETHVDGYPELKLITTTQLNGNTEFNSDMPAQEFTFQDDEVESISIGESSLKGSISVLGKLDYDFSMARLELDYANGTVMSFNGLTSAGVGSFEQSMWLGQQTLGLDGFLVSDPERVAIVEMNGMKYQLETGEDKTTNTLQGDYHLTLDEFSNVDGEAQNLDLQFTAGGFDKDAFLALSDMYKQSPMWTDEDTVKALPQVDALLQKGFHLSLKKFSVDVDMGHFDSSWDIRLPENEENSTQDFFKLLEQMQGNMNAFVSSDLVLAYPYIQQNLDELLIMEIATQTDKGYEVNLKLHDGKVAFANGKEVPMMALMMPMLMPKPQ
ncbi:hypothetical protein JCM19241_3276 [Vibrio ishigakensis]|uniref:DUF945 domain-containing protein n=2 Tax=Vibrio ishigakensis TaxID=1481914 RepID=A0A0B8QLM5_9VIBR|nr:hypothetical protein JCM19241_3276 [Vibrio ishigakensis]